MILITSLLICLLFIVSGTSASPDIHFSYNSPSSWENIIRYGDAKIAGGVLQLTGTKDRCGWATYNNNIPLVDNATGDLTSFITHFSFIMNSTLNGHGFAFFISSNLQPLSECGSNLGLFPDVDHYTGNPQNQMVAVEFDNYDNKWDPRFDHVGIDVNNIYSAVVYKLCDNIAKANGSLAHAWVSYNAGDQTMNVSLNDHGSELPDHPVLSHKVNLAQLLPAPAAAVKIGFSAANYYDQVHQILSWEFNSSTLKIT